MKKSIKMLAAIWMCALMLCVAQTTIAQKNKTSRDSIIKSLVEEQRYTFYAQNVTPMSGRQRFLTSDYTLSVAKDTVVCDLPYFGRAYTAPVNPSEGGIKFSSADFSYAVSPKSKGGWDIVIKPRDVPNARQLTLNIFQNGTAFLQVTGSDRQPISFNGYIKEKPVK